MKKKNNFIFICGSGRCGTTLMRSLLDGHSKLNVYPLELSKYLEFFFRISGYKKSIRSDSLSEIFLNQFLLEKKMQEKLNFKVNLNEIYKNFNKIKNKNITPGDILLLIANIHFKKPNNSYVFDVTSTNISGYLDNFKNSKVIHMVRHPYDTLNSFYKERYKDPNSFGGSHPGSWEFGKGFEIIEKSFEQAHLLSKNKNVLIVKLEDLQKEPKSILKKLFDFLNLDEEPINYKQTILGKLFKNNSSTFQSNKIINQKKDWSYLTNNDIYYLSRINYFEIYKISKEKFKKNNFFTFLLRHLGLKGINRPKIKSLYWLVFRSLPSSISFYIQDLYYKDQLNSKLLNYNDFTFLNGKNIYLRSLNKEDVYGNWWKWFNDKSVTKFMNKGNFKNSTKKQLAYFEKINNSKSDKVLAICDKKTDCHIGTIGLHNINFKNNSAQFGIIIGEKLFWGMGVGSEAWSMMINYGFKEIGLNLIHTKIFSNNEYSLRIAQKLGFKHVKTLTNDVIKDKLPITREYMTLSYKNWLKIINSTK